MSRSDPRFVVGALVHAKAIHVTSSIECHRRYGSLAKTKLVNGVVTAVETVPLFNGKRSATMLTANYYLGGGTVKSYIMNSRNVKAGHVAAVPNEDNGPVTEFGIQNSTSTATTTNGATQGNDANPVPADVERIVNAAAAASDRALLEDSSDEEETIERVEGRRPSIGIGDVVAHVHGFEWRRSFFELTLNGSISFRQWNVKTVIGDTLVPGRDRVKTNDMTPIDFFLLMFPPSKQLNNMIHWTNVQLVDLKMDKTNTSELLKFFGIIILSTTFEFTSREACGRQWHNQSIDQRLSLVSLECQNIGLMNSSGQ